MTTRWAGLERQDGTDDIELGDDGDTEIRDGPADEGSGGTATAKPSQATQLVDLVLPLLELFHDGDEAYADMTVDRHRETHRLRNSGFRSWLRQQFFEVHAKVPNSEAVQSALAVLEGYALFKGPQQQVFVRIATLGDTTYVDLGAENWKAVAIDASGWEVVEKPEARFVRPNGLWALPAPVRGGHLDELRPFVNVNDDDWILCKAWQVNTLRTFGSHGILMFSGEQGSAKTSACRNQRELVDPNEAGLRAKPRDEHALVIAAKNAWVVGFDNLSNISEELADGLCRLATGAGFGTRKLYTDDEEAIFSARRPVVINSIGEASSRPDLLDRAIMVEGQVIADEDRRSDAEVAAAWQAARPRLFGALLDCAVTALANRRSARPRRLPRMADFATWAMAAAPAYGCTPDEVLEALFVNRKSAAALALDDSPVARHIVDLVRNKEDKTWEGSATDLLGDLDSCRGESRPRGTGPPALRRWGQRSGGWHPTCAARASAWSRHRAVGEMVGGTDWNGRARGRHHAQSRHRSPLTRENVVTTPGDTLATTQPGSSPPAVTTKVQVRPPVVTAGAMVTASCTPILILDSRSRGATVD